MLASKLRGPMSTPKVKVTLEIWIGCELLTTSRLDAFERLFLQVYGPYVPGQMVCLGKHNSAVGILTHHLLFPMSH